MAEDPDLSRQRIEHQQLRKQLNEVFGPFEQFCEYVAGTNSAGSSGIMRHGVVQSPITDSHYTGIILTIYAADFCSFQYAYDAAVYSTTSTALQSMQNLVTSPIQPLQGLPFSCNRDYLNTAPSSSTHCSSDGHDSIAKKGKRNRAMDSDTEVEREKRRRGKDDSRSTGMPGTSRSNTHPSSNSDGLRALFGDTVDRKDPPDKGISPDSGVHSAENDPGDENDMHSAQTIINLITKLSPPLSPIKQRPSDKKAERERREAELKERERRAREREEADASDRKDKSLERKEKTKPVDTEKAKSSASGKKRDDSATRADGLRGEIILKGLDRSKLNQLFEIGRRTGRMKEERKEDRKEKSESKEERRKEKKEREKKSKDKLTVEDALRKEKESSARSSPCLPRASSSQSHEDQASSHSRPSSAVSNHPSRSGFECAAEECAPTRPARPVKPEEGSTELLYDFYNSIARSRKRKGDAEVDKVTKVLLYLDATAYFILSAKHFNAPDAGENRANRQYSIIRDTNDLLKRITHMFNPQSDGCSPWHLHMLSRVRNLSLRCQSCLMFHLYNLRSHNALKTYTILAQMDTQIQEENQAQNGSSAPNTSSPGSSVHSNSNQSTTMVTMPSRVYEVQKQQLKTLHQLMWAHRVWQDAAKRADVSTTDMAFIGGLEKVCGALFLDAPLEKMSAYLLTGIAWLRGEYEREKVRPPPPTSKRTAAPS
ncbi:hypothetical protein ANCCAN_12519 [Ancylostoma caninum]|uniref:AF4/FMR2 family member lilli n=2 Tax=Ancylostoma TaxID=29169 RepID=A0A368GAY0_ANCCA|nr:hypothetical protein ANCCAN_12519 [Ancylostoma caninum]